MVYYYKLNFVSETPVDTPQWNFQLGKRACLMHGCTLLSLIRLPSLTHLLAPCHVITLDLCLLV